LKDWFELFLLSLKSPACTAPYAIWTLGTVRPTEDATPVLIPFKTV